MKRRCNPISIRQFSLCIFYRFEPVSVQTLLSEPSIEGFHDSVVGRFAATTEVEGDFIGVGPQIHLSTSKLGPVVAGNPLWQSTVILQMIRARGPAQCEFLQPR